MPTPARQAPTGRPGGRTLEVSTRIYRATMALLSERGYNAVTFQSVADRAEVGRATLYRRWKTRADLVETAIRAVAAEQIVVKATGHFRDDLKQVLRQIAAFITGPVGLAALVAGLSIRLEAGVSADPVDRWAERRIDLSPIFSSARERGELAADIDDDVLFAMIAGALYYRVIVMGHKLDDKWIDEILNAASIY